MAGTDLATRPTNGSTAISVAARFDDDMRLAEMMAKSGFFRDTPQAAQAIVKIMFGREMGIGPAQAMSQIYIVEGRPALGAGIIASLIRRSGKYDYRIAKLDDQGCELAFTERGRQVGVSSFTWKDAEAAGLAGRQVWKAYRRNMLFARAMSNGARWYCPDIFGGAVYTPEELQGGADIIDASIIEQPARTVDTATGEIVEPEPEPAATLEPEQDEPASQEMAQPGEAEAPQVAQAVAPAQPAGPPAHPATARQKEAITNLCRTLGQDAPDLASLSQTQASEEIKRLSALMARS